MLLLLKRKIICIANSLKALRGWKLVKNLMFSGAGLLMLSCVYAGFWRLLGYLEGVQLIGPILSWKLTSMVLLITFAMVIVSSIIISMTTLYYSRDLKFLFSCPLAARTVFLDKALETVFYSSWTLLLVLAAYILALGRVKGLGADFYLAYAALMAPLALIAGAFGIIFSMLVMYAFPSSRTRDVTWVLGSASMSFVYVMVCFSKPEKLIRPDALAVVAQYIDYLQSPTAPYLPSWWVTRAAMAYTSGQWADFWFYAALLFATAAVLYGFMYYLSGFVYARGFSGAQGSPRFSGGNKPLWEQRMALKIPRAKAALTLLWKDRLLLARDARYWSQAILILALVLVYLFSIRQLPLDTPALKSFISFLNIGVAGFVLAAVGLRFTFPAISLEGNCLWLIKAAPVSAPVIMAQKLLLCAAPSLLLGVVLISFSNYMLKADLFVSLLSVFTIAAASVALSVMGIGLGAVFSDYNVENIHQLESSYGGFIYMASAMGYISLVVAIEAWPVRMHFAGQFGREGAWDYRILSLCALMFALVNAAAVILPWKAGCKSFENQDA